MQATTLSEPQINDLGAPIRAELGIRRMTVAELARQTGVKRGTLANHINYGDNLTVKNLLLIAAALNVDPVTLLPKAA